MNLFPLKPNWVRPVSETWAYLTEVIESESGQEQRRARRLRPRHALGYSALDLRGRAQARRQQATTLSDTQVFADPIRTTVTTAVAASGQGVLPVQTRDWLGSAAWLVIDLAAGPTLVEVDSVTGGNVTLSDFLAATVPSGTRVSLGQVGRLKPQQTVNLRTNTITTGNVDMSVEPGREALVVGSAPLTFNGREVVSVRPNWSDDPQVEYEDSQTYTDVESGPRVPYRRRDWTRETWRHNYSIRSDAEANAVVGAFHRARGRQGELYQPSWFNDFPLLETVVSGSKFWRTASHGFGDAYAASPVHKAIAVVTKQGAVHYFRVAQITTGGTSPLWSMIETVEAAPQTFAPADIDMICWMPVVRFASDELLVTWLTDGLAETNITLITLEAQP